MDNIQTNRHIPSPNEVCEARHVVRVQGWPQVVRHNIKTYRMLIHSLVRLWEVRPPC